MSEKYDKATGTLWVQSDADGDTLVESSQIQSYTKALQAGELPDGRSLASVNFVFPNSDGAVYNHQALAFSNMGTYIGSLDSPEPFDEDSPAFDTRKDFGM